MDASIRFDDKYVYADVIDAPPKEEVYINLQSEPVSPNPSTTGAGNALHKTANADGTCNFRVIRAALLVDPDDDESNFPREISVAITSPIASEIITA
jgi:hypothetical protein